jgi:glyoxylase I family protein
VNLTGIHHVAIICSDYAASKRFYTETLGFPVIAEAYRKERQSYKLDLALPGGAQIELFSFPSPPARPSHPEACGLRHLAFQTPDIESALASLAKKGVPTEPLRVDAFTGRRYTFFADPDGLPIELYEIPEVPEN